MLLQESEVLVCVDNIRVRQSFKAGSKLYAILVSLLNTDNSLSVVLSPTNS